MEQRKSKRPRCPVCHSKRWHKDSLSGSIVCEEGHLLQGYVQESNETQEASQYATITRRIRKNRIKKQRKQNNDHFHGERGVFLLWQAMQWILREEFRVLVEELGYPAEIEVVGRELWAMLVASSKVRPSPRDYVNGDEPATSYSGNREGMRYRKKGRKRKGEDGEAEEERTQPEVAKMEGDETGSSGADVESDDEDDEEERGFKVDKMDLDVGNLDDDDDERTKPPREGTPFYDLRKTPAEESRASQKDPRSKPRAEYLLLILYLSCVTLRLPVMLKDILDLAESHKILYVAAYRHLPAEMQLHLGTEATQLLQAAAVPRSGTEEAGIQHWLSKLVTMYQDDWDVRFPEANVPLLSWRLHRSLACSPTIYIATQRLLSLLPSLTFDVSRKNDRRGKLSRYSKHSLPEATLVAGIIISMRLLYNLDGVDREEAGTASMTKVSKLDEWLKALQKVSELEDPEDLGRLWSKDVASFNDDDVDGYLDFFEAHIVSNTNLPTHMSDLNEHFPAPPHFPSSTSSSSSDAYSTSINTLLTTLYTTTPAESSTSSGGTYLSYHANSPTLPAPLHYLLTHAASLIGFTPSELLQVVNSIEYSLEKREKSGRAGSETKEEGKEATRETMLRAKGEGKQRWSEEMERRKRLKALDAQLAESRVETGKRERQELKEQRLEEKKRKPPAKIGRPRKVQVVGAAKATGASGSGRTLRKRKKEDVAEEDQREDQGGARADEGGARGEEGEIESRGRRKKRVRYKTPDKYNNPIT
ncbi:RNA polymerase I specific transcription initiation factor Rrn7 [Pseudohyphozyma bogoriensis]|nr:RNA polymerase I specific transcription initiation factor Rrn7 [Pseudohyphozyma bogoriensis]